MLHTTIDKTRARTTKHYEVMERIRDRIILEHKDLLILVINLENHQGWKESAWDVENQTTSWDRSVHLRMLSARTATKLEHFHKVCQTKKRAKQRANLVQTPPKDDDDTHIDENGVRQPNPLLYYVQVHVGTK